MKCKWELHTIINHTYICKPPNGSATPKELLHPVERKYIRVVAVLWSTLLMMEQEIHPDLSRIFEMSWAMNAKYMCSHRIGVKRGLNISSPWLMLQFIVGE
jgi:hypothetical protein